MFNRLNDKRLSLIIAPTGYGKSALINSWVDKEENIHIWYNADSNDQIAEFFLNNLFIQLKQIINKSIVPETYRIEQKSLDDVQNDILSLASELDSKYTLIIDDYHRIQNTLIDSFIQKLALTTQIRLIISSRIEPAFDLLEWKKTGELNCIKSLDLSLNENDLTNYLRAKFSDVSEKLVLDFLRFTQGWFAGIQIVLSNSNDIKELAGYLNDTSNNRLDFNKQVNNFLENLNPSIRKSILKISLLDIIDLDFLHLHVKSELSNVDIQKFLFAEDLFLIQLDKNGVYYRYHDLYGEELRKRALTVLSQTEQNSFLKSAAEWFASRLELEEAHQLYVRCEFQEEIFEVHQLLRVKYLQEARWDKLELIIEALTQKGLTHNQIYLSEVWLTVHKGLTHRLLELGEKFEKSLEDGNYNNAKEKAEMCVIIAYWTFNSSRDFEKIISYCDFALKYLPIEYSYARGYAWVFLLGSLQAQGKMDEAIIRMNDIKGNLLFQEMEYQLLTMCYCAWMQADMNQLKYYSNKLYQLSEKTNNKEARCHALHFKKLLAYETAEFAEFELIHKEQSTVIEYGIGLIRLFSKLLNLSYTKLCGNSSWKEDIESVLNETQVTKQILLGKYVSGHYLSLAMEDGRLSFLDKLYKESILDYIIPITNNSDPNLHGYAYLLSTGKAKYHKTILRLKNDIWTYATDQHNIIAYFKLTIIELGFDKDLSIEEKVSRYMILIEKAIIRDLWTLFLEYSATLSFLIKEIKRFNNIQQDFIKRLVFKGNELEFSSKNFTIREMEIIENLDLKISNSELAALLYISEKTLKNHLTSIYRKLDVKSKREAVMKFNPHFL